LHYQASFPEVLVKLVVRDDDPLAARATFSAIDQELAERLGASVYGFDRDSLAAALGRQLAGAGETLTSAESCTGGLIGARVTDPPGASEWYLGGLVAYDNRVKTEWLGVAEETLEAHGAVSEECVKAMALGVRDRLGSSWGLAVSGTAGPTGGTLEKPVGTVWLAVAGPHGIAKTKRFVWPGTRAQVRSLAAFWAMALVLRCSQDLAVEG